ncbi:MAG: hypothetical protein AUH35_03490 [Nitrospirae bacterium 13_1_40CM_62_7]|nr:MAG: hypothetical protein AUH35_03490 [Nitrospirae bacterium 13_1_40CM_62_7]
MSASLLVSLKSCDDPALVGGKAAGLGWLLADLDPARQWAEVHCAPQDSRGPLLEEWRRRVAALTLPRPLQETLHLELTALGLGQAALWAVRSSASDEDKEEATFAGVYRTVLGVLQQAIPAAIVECWASLWTPAAFAYHQRLGRGGVVPAMAVVLQPLLSPRAAGVAYSCHPVTGQRDQVVINAVFGLAEPLVSGQMIPDQYTVEVRTQPESKKLLQQEIAQKPIARLVTLSEITDHPLPEEDWGKPVLAGHEALELAALAKRVERGLGRPVDIEWALDGSATWLLQARAIPASGAGFRLTERTCVWSRANFKETMPEVPSPLGLAFLQEFMEHNILRHYRELGCTIPPGLRSVRIIQGRPFINVTLFQSFMAQLWGDPAQITEQMGGEGTPFQSQGAPPRLPWWKLLRAALLMECRIRRAARRAPVWFARLDRFGRRLNEADVTLAIVGGVSQGLRALQFLLARWAGDGWRSLLNTALQGLGDVVTASQILWLRDLAELVREDDRARAFFSKEPFAPDTYRDRLTGTGFLREFDNYLDEFGHRALGESDVMAPRFRERPDYLLGVIRELVKGPASPRSAEVLRRHEAARQGALQEIRRRFGARLLRSVVFRWLYRRLCRSISLREANRHHLMYFTATVRRLILIIGQHFVTRGTLATPDDVFFLTPDEMRLLVLDHGQDWKGLISGRRSERARNEALSVPDVAGPATRLSQAPSDRGLSISAGYAEGPARLLLRPEDAEKVRQGDILVVPVIDPGIAPLLGLAAGLIAEMGGTLSHGAIIVREYGIPAIVNIPRVTRLLRDGERVAVDASLGVITRLNSDTVSQ